jgi:hypothetical protein
MAKEPAYIEYFVARGEDVTFPVTHTVSQDDPTPVDITGWTIGVQARNGVGVLLLDVAGSIVSGPAGTYSWSITNAISSVIPPGLYPLEIWRTNVGARRAMMMGALRIGKDVRYP